MRIPSAIKLHKASKTLELQYGAEARYTLSAEFRRRLEQDRAGWQLRPETELR
jgi:DUF971 family protein